MANAWIPAALTLASAGLNAYGQAKTAEAEQAAAYSTAFQQEQQAKQERAVSQLQAARQRREGKAQLSTQKSLLASSGFAADDPTSIKLVTETVGAQTLEEMLTLAQGEDSARQMEFAAKQTRKSGDNAYSTGRTNAAVTLLNSGVSWADRYGTGSRNRGQTPTPQTKARAG